MEYQSFDFFVSGAACAALSVPFARPIFDCISVEILDAYVEHASPETVGPVFVREPNIERRLFPDRGSEPVARTAMACVLPTSPATTRSPPMVTPVLPQGLRRTIRNPFGLTQLDFALTDAAGQGVTAARATLHVRVLYAAA